MNRYPSKMQRRLGVPRTLRSGKILNPAINQNFRHENYSRYSTRIYEKLKYPQVITAYAAHCILIGDMIIYFSFEEPIGLYHSKYGHLACENYWHKMTAHHLNLIDRDDDNRVSQEDLDRIIKECLKIEVNKW